MIDNKWEEKFSFIEKYIFNFIFNSRLKFYGYKNFSVTIIDFLIVPFLIPIPLKLEISVFMLSLENKLSLKDKVYILRINFIGYFRRVALFYKYYFLQVLRRKFERVFITCND